MKLPHRRYCTDRRRAAGRISHREGESRSVGAAILTATSFPPGGAYERGRTAVADR